MNTEAQKVFDNDLTPEQRDEFRIILRTDKKRQKFVSTINVLAAQGKYAESQFAQARLHKHEDNLLADYYDKLLRSKTLTLEDLYKMVTPEQKKRMQIICNAMHLYYDLFDSAAQDLIAACKKMGYRANTAENMKRAAKPFVDMMRDLSGGMKDEWVGAFGEEEDKVDEFAKNRVRIFLDRQERKKKRDEANN